MIIDRFGYDSYAQENIECYSRIIDSASRDFTTIIVCSSGFMTYREDIHSDYVKIKKQIFEHPLTFVLLPSLCLERCVQEILKRQMGRSYLKIQLEKEQYKITKRFYIYSQLPCKMILTNVEPLCVLNNIKNEIYQYIKF
ncbi:MULTISPECIES: hypothetical protein [unclassified Acinetobacter]|uniref:hypothetical protein n=1 Tax=unclassified Acinetobacter TaxID=196816 RepID=UPI001D0E1715|nr:MULTISPECIES: hypothetical protein [unclassified Acinetobacter]